RQAGEQALQGLEVAPIVAEQAFNFLRIMLGVELGGAHQGGRDAQMPGSLFDVATELAQEADDSVNGQSATRQIRDAPCRSGAEFQVGEGTDAQALVHERARHLAGRASPAASNSLKLFAR